MKFKIVKSGNVYEAWYKSWWSFGYRPIMRFLRPEIFSTIEEAEEALKKAFNKRTFWEEDKVVKEMHD